MKAKVYVEAHKPSEPFPPEISNRRLRKLLVIVKPYTFQIVMVVLTAVFLSFLTGITQLSLTPLLYIVLGNDVPQAGTNTAQGLLSFNLDKIGPALLGMTSKATGLTDRWQLLAVTSLVYLGLILFGQAIAFGARVWIARLRFS